MKLSRTVTKDFFAHWERELFTERLAIEDYIALIEHNTATLQYRVTVSIPGNTLIQMTIKDTVQSMSEMKLMVENMIQNH